MLETCTSATSFVFGETFSARSCISISSVSVKRTCLSVAPDSWHTICHGTKLAWCSATETTTCTETINTIVGVVESAHAAAGRKSVGKVREACCQIVIIITISTMYYLPGPPLPSAEYALERGSPHELSPQMILYSARQHRQRASGLWGRAERANDVLKEGEGN